MEEGKIIDIKIREKFLPIVKKEHGYCDHKYTEVDPDERTLNCTKCGAYIDPFNYVLGLAYEERNIHQWIEILTKERSDLFDEKEKLKREVSYLRSQKKKLNKNINDY